ncbi:bacteriocin [Clostridium sporogenes]|uniref:bacteriocin n=1 Tax=Clostridium TaxID=1485 RepID=UPI00131BB42B|nr:MULTISPECIES: bacteriocin [Clostridium]
MKKLNEKELSNTNGGREIPTVNLVPKIIYKYIRHHAGDGLNKPGWRIPGQ